MYILHVPVPLRSRQPRRLERCQNDELRHIKCRTIERDDQYIIQRPISHNFIFLRRDALFLIYILNPHSFPNYFRHLYLPHPIPNS